VQPLEWSATPEAYFTNLARDAPRGTYPRPYVGEQCAWTVVGPDSASEEVLLSEDGMVETGKRQFSIEPFLWVNGRLITWADVKAMQRLEPGMLPAPVVIWERPDLTLTIDATAWAGTVVVDYRVKNRQSQPRKVRLYLVARPFQVNPPWQNI